MPDNYALKAAYGEDTMDLLDHIAWTDVVRPQLEKARKHLTDQLVAVTLAPAREGQETREQIAGKLYGISYITNVFEKILKEGANAKEVLAKDNFFISNNSTF